MACFIAAFSAASTAAQERDWAQSLERDFAGGGSVRIKLSPGGHEIRGTPDNKIRVSWATKKPEDMRKARVDVKITGTSATIQSHGPKSDFRVVIEIPMRTSLHARMTAGELDVVGIRGDQDVQLRFGDLEIQVGYTGDFNHVDGSVTMGGLEASAFQVSKGGMWRSFKWSGAGDYRLRAHVSFGELTLRKVKEPETRTARLAM